MYEHPTNIILVSDDPERYEKLYNLLKDTKNKIEHYSLKKALTLGLTGDRSDLVVFDCYAVRKFDYRILQPHRELPKLEKIPFLFILDANQETLKRQIYKNPHNKILIEPFDKFAFISLINSAIHVNVLERRISIYQDMIEGERKMISYMNDLIGMDEISSLKNEDDLFEHLKQKFVKRLELTLAVETALFAVFDAERDILSMSVSEKNGGTLIRKHTFSIKKSIVFESIQNNLGHIFEKMQIGDPFIQELEEALGLKIFSMLFIPISVFHKPRAGVILINKLYRDEFSENDFAFSTIASHNITYQFERLQLEKAGTEELLTPGLALSIEDKIREEWNLYRQIMDSVNFGTLVFDEALNIIYINRVAFDILNSKLDHRKKLHLSELFTEEEYSQLKNVLSNQKIPIVRQELQLHQQQIPHFFIGYSIYEFEPTKAPARYIMVFSEISQTKRIQAEIIRMDRMASLGVLSSGIAHEIRNPLAGIKAMAQSLEDEISAESSQIEYVSRIIRQVNRMDDLLKAFFTYAKPLRPDPDACHIKEIINEVIPLLKRRMLEKNITIEQVYSGDLQTVFVDKNQIEQVFLNLFINALDAMNGGGKLTISAHNAGDPHPLIDRRSLPTLLSHRYIEITVSDTGSGIPQELCDKIFNPFFTTKAHGTGLGLSIVYQIIKEHGGNIEVQNKSDKGTEFLILLPALERKAK